MFVRPCQTDCSGVTNRSYQKHLRIFGTQPERLLTIVLISVGVVRVLAEPILRGPARSSLCNAGRILCAHKPDTGTYIDKPGYDTARTAKLLFFSGRQNHRI